MQERCTSLDIAEMQAEYNRRPWGEMRSDKMLALICQTLFMCHVKSGTEIPGLEAWTPFIQTPELSEAEREAKLKRMFGGG